MNKQTKLKWIANAIRWISRKGLSIDPSGACMYRGLVGARCAIGANIPNHLYHPKMENSTISVGRVWKVLTKLGARRRDQEFLERLQSALDIADSKASALASLREFRDELKAS